VWRSACPADDEAGECEQHPGGVEERGGRRDERPEGAGNLAASAIAGALWTLISPTAAFLYAAWMLLALTGLIISRAR